MNRSDYMLPHSSRKNVVEGPLGNSKLKNHALFRPHLAKVFRPYHSDKGIEMKRQTLISC